MKMVFAVRRRVLPQRIGAVLFAATPVVLGVAFAMACVSDVASLPVSDASVADAGSLLGEASTDGAGGSDSGARYCDSTAGADYCEDFDGPTEIKDLDVETSLVGPLPFAFTRETARSQPRALRWDMPAGAPEGSYAVYKRAFDGERTVRVEWDWFIATPPVSGNLTLQLVTLKRRAPQVAFGGTCSVEGGAPQCSWFVSRCTTKFCDELHTFPTPPFVDAWARVFLEAKLTEKDGHLRFGVVGAPPIVDVPADVTLGLPLTALDKTVLSIGGANLQGVSPGVTTYFDNVVVTTTP